MMRQMLQQRAAQWTATIAALALLLSFAMPTFAEPKVDGRASLLAIQDAFVEIAETVAPAVVNIQSEVVITRTAQRSPFSDELERFFEGFPFGDQFFFGPPRTPRERDSDSEPPTREERRSTGGSGVIVSEDGYILTNHHVVDNAERIIVSLADRREYEAEVVGSDPAFDIGLLKISANGLPTAQLGDSDRTRVGDWVIAIGNPFRLSHTVTSGIISAKGRFVGIGMNPDMPTFENFIQTDAAINPGNSGGPLLNLDGEVIGINTAILSRSGGFMGVGLAIPVNIAKAIYEQLRETGEITHGFLGIWLQDMTAELAEDFGLELVEGILITEMEPETPAEKAGLQVGDIVQTLNGRPMRDMQEFRTYVALNRPGSEIELGIIREGREMKVKVTLGERPTDFARADRRSPDEQQLMSDLGFSVQNLTEDLATELGFEGRNGVLVTDVERNSPAARAGLRTGMLIQQVNQQDISNVNEFSSIAQEAIAERNRLLLLVSSVTTRGQVVSQFMSIRVR